jgi:hypothetical protein
VPEMKWVAGIKAMITKKAAAYNSASLVAYQI